MLDPEQINDRRLFLQRLRELTAERIEQELAEQQQTWKKLLEEKNLATSERLAACKNSHRF